MLKEERLNYILEEIRTYNRVVSSELSKKLTVSEDTIRRDLKELSDSGQIKKVHGGAMAMSYLPFKFKDREVYAHESKVKIVKKAIQHIIRDDMVYIIDGGTTNLELARLLPKELKATFFTNSLPVAIQLSDYKDVEIIFVGGKILKSAQVAIGLDVIVALEGIRADICFLGTRSIHHEIGITDIDREEAQVKKAIIKASNQVVSLAITEKIDIVQPYVVEGIKGIHTLVTDMEHEDKKLVQYKKMGLEII